MPDPVIPTPVARALVVAQQFFVDCLSHQSIGRTGREYLASRVSVQTAHDARLGFAPKGYLARMDGVVDRDTLFEIGLVDHYGRESMAGRVTFPWISAAGTYVVGIGGRKVDETSARPKYANSPERPWFNKGRVLFGGYQATQAMHSVGWAPIVEGPFDALAMWEHGWTNAVATVGAKVSIHQLALVARYCDSAIVLLDADEGGRRGSEAVRKHLERDELLPLSFEVRTATLPPNKDPAECSLDEIRMALEESLPTQRTLS